MDHVYNDQIAPTRHLNFYAKANAGTVHHMAFGPVRRASLSVSPATNLLEASIDDPPEGSSAVGITGFFNEQLKTDNNFAELGQAMSAPMLELSERQIVI